MKQSIRPFENVFTILSLLLFSHGFYPVILGNITGEGDVESPLLRMIFICIYFVTLGLLVFRWRRTLVFATSHLWLLVLIGLAVFSISWSSIPGAAFRSVISLMGATMFGVYLGSRYDFEHQLKIYSWTFGIALFFSYIFSIALPQYGVMNTEAIVGAWQGIFPHKNGLGESMVVASMTFYFSSLTNVSRGKKIFFQGCCFLSVVIIYFAQSATSLMSVLFLFAIVQGLKRLSITSKKSVLVVLLFTIFSCIVLFLFVANFEAFLIANNRDVTLSGRKELWETLWQFIQEKPWLGYGYGSFFTARSREGSLLWQTHTWIPVHAHNGFVQLWINLGFIGLSIFIFGYLSCMFTSLFKYLVFKDLRMLWVFLFLIYTVFLNMTEVSFFGSDNIWIITLASIYSIKIKTTKTIVQTPVASTS